MPTCRAASDFGPRIINGQPGIWSRTFHAKQRQAIGVDKVFDATGTRYPRTRTHPRVEPALRCKFLVRGENRIARHAEHLCKDAARREASAAGNPSVSDNAAECGLDSLLQRFSRWALDRDERNDNFGGSLQNGSFQSYTSGGILNRSGFA